MKDESMLTALIELAAIFIRNHSNRIVNTNPNLVKQILQGFHILTFNLVVDNHEYLEEIIDWNGLFIRCLEIWQEFLDSVRLSLENSTGPNKTSSFYVGIYPELMEALVQAIQCRASSKVAGLDRQKSFTADIKQTDDNENDEVEDTNLSEWDEFFQNIISTMVEMGRIPEASNMVFNRLVGLMDDASTALKEEIMSIKSMQDSAKRRSTTSFDSSCSTDMTQGIEPLLQDIAAVITAFEQMFEFASHDTTVKQVFQQMFEITIWTESCPEGFLIYEELITEVFTACLFSLKAVLPWVYFKVTKKIND